MSTNLLSMNSLSPGRDLASYVQTVSAFPILSAEEEKALAERFYYENDLDAARELVLCHLRFVVHLARSYQGYGLPQADLIQEGNVGLMKAVKRFNPEVGVRLVSFAVHWIKAEMHEFILRNWRIAKVATTKAQRKLFFNLRSAKKRLAWLTKEETESVAGELGVPVEEVARMESRLAGSDLAFDGYDTDDGESNAHRPISCRERGWRAPIPRSWSPPRTGPRRPAKCCTRQSRNWTTAAARSLRHAGSARRQGDACGTGRALRGIRRTHPPDRAERHEEDQGDLCRRPRGRGPDRRLSQRTYIRRRGRMTRGQRRALATLADKRYVVDPEPGEWPRVFARAAPIGVEIGFGMGQSLLDWAAAEPGRSISIGIEIYEPGIGALLAGIERRGAVERARAPGRGGRTPGREIPCREHCGNPHLVSRIPGPRNGTTSAA